MKKSQLRELVLEVIRGGRSDYYPGVETPGLTPDIFNAILKNIALGKKYSDEDKYVGDPKKGHDLMNKVSQETIDAVINGTYKLKQESMNEDNGLQKYTVFFYTNDDDHDWDVMATSEEDAIEKVKSGKAKGPYDQDLPRLARKFSAKKVG